MTLGQNNSLKEALDMIINKSIGSIVVTDNDGNPTGIITTRDFLNLLNQATKFKIEDILKNISKESSRILNSFLSSLSRWASRIPNISKFKSFF